MSVSQDQTGRGGDLVESAAFLRLLGRVRLNCGETSSPVDMAKEFGPGQAAPPLLY